MSPAFQDDDSRGSSFDKVTVDDVLDFGLCRKEFSESNPLRLLAHHIEMRCEVIPTIRHAPLQVLLQLELV